MTTPGNQSDKPWPARRGEPPSGGYEAPPVEKAPTQSSYERRPPPPFPHLPPPPAQSAPDTRRIRRMAVASLWMSILSFISDFIMYGVGIIGAIVGIVLGIGVLNVSTQGKEYWAAGGRGFARGGIIVGTLALALGIIALF